MGHAALHHAVNGFFDVFKSKSAPAAQPASRAARVKVESRYNEDDEESLLESANSLPRQTLKALEKQLRTDGFKGAMVSGWNQGDRGGFTVHYGGEKYEFEISENVTPRPMGEIGRLVKESGRYDRNGRGIYHGTPAGKNDMVLHQDHRGRWRIDLVTSAGGNHTDVTEHEAGTAGNSGYTTPELAFRSALDIQRKKGIRGKSHVFIADRDGNLSDYEPMEANGRKKSVTVADLKTGGGGMVLACPGCHETFGADKSDYFQMGPREVFKCMNCGANLQLRKEARPRPTALDDGWAEDDYVVSVIDRDGGIGLFRVQRGGWRNTDPLTVGYKLEQISDVAERDARARGVQDAVVWDGDEGRQIGHVLRGRWQVEMETNGRATIVDTVAARELDLYIANTYELVGATNSIGKSIDTNLRRKVANGSYDPTLAPKAWQALVDAGAKRYERELGSGSPIFNAATRRQVAADFAQEWEASNAIEQRVLELTGPNLYAEAAKIPASGRFHSQVFLAPLLERFGTTPQKARQKLLELHRANEIVLSRADLVEAMDPELVKRSAIDVGNYTFHLLSPW